MKKIIRTDVAPAPIGPYSQAVQFGNILFLSGQIAIDADKNVLVTGSIEQETHQVMSNIGAVLGAAGYSFEDVVKTTIFLKDLNDFDVVNKVYGTYFDADYPARETVQVSRLPKDVNVEISVIAAK